MTAELRQSEDPTKTDLELVCTDCGKRLCDAESGDEIGTLQEVAESHEGLCDKGLKWELVVLRVPYHDYQNPPSQWDWALLADTPDTVEVLN